MIWSLFLTGLLMVIMGYVGVFGTRHHGTPLSSIAAPLNVISHIYGVSYFRIPLSLGAMIGFFSLSLSLSCLNAGSRIARIPGQAPGLRPRHLMIAVLAFLCLLVPTVGSFYPLPPYPVDIFPCIFLACVLVGAIWLFAVSRGRRGLLAEIETDLENTLHAHEQRPVPADSAAGIPAAGTRS